VAWRQNLAVVQVHDDVLTVRRSHPTRAHGWLAKSWTKSDRQPLRGGLPIGVIGAGLLVLPPRLQLRCVDAAAPGAYPVGI
jgi:hypothetical protein